MRQRIVNALLCLLILICMFDKAGLAQSTTEQRATRPKRADSAPSSAPGSVVQVTSTGVTFADNTTQTTAATLTGVTPGSGLTGGGTKGNVPLAVDTTVARTTAGNSFLGAQAITGNVTVTGAVQISGAGNGLKFPDGTTQTTAATGGGSSTLSGTLTINSGTSFASGTCTNSGVTLTGATTSMVAVVSPQGDPSAKGLNELLWGAFVDASDHVTVQFCHFSHSTASASSSQVFNIRVIP